MTSARAAPEPRPTRRADLGGGVQAVLSRYRPGERQGRHSHEVHELTVLLAGDLCETLAGRAYDCRGGWAAFKPAGAAHADVWGLRGAVVFSLKLPPGALGDEPPDAGWRPVERAAPVGLMSACFAAGGGAAETVADLLACLGPPRRPGAPPPWLARAHDQIRCEPQRASLAQVAAACGVSRTHFAQAFHRCYGQPPSLFRRQAMAAEALRLALDDAAPLADAAAAAGFADQSHMHRTVKAMTGVAPRALQRALCA
jgi:AraC-like DNA-binding protein